MKISDIYQCVFECIFTMKWYNFRFMRKIFVGGDHAGFTLKKAIKEYL